MIYQGDSAEMAMHISFILHQVINSVTGKDMVLLLEVVLGRARAFHREIDFQASPLPGMQSRATSR